MNIAAVFLISLLLSYFLFIPVYLVILIEKEKLINMIIESKNPRRRVELAKHKLNTRKDFILSIVWPFILIREIKNALKAKK